MNSSFSSQGQPPTLQNSTRQNLFCCQICNKTTNVSNSIFCNKCELNYHQSCANIDSTQLNQNWICQNCSTQHSTPLDSPHSIRSHLSISSHNSRSRRHILELQRLQEETKLQREFINKKYAILQQANKDEDYVQTVNSSIHEWLNNQPDLFEQHTTVDAPQQNDTTFTCTTNIQPNLATTSKNNAVTNISTFIDNEPQNYSHKPIENMSTINYNNGQPQMSQTPTILYNAPSYFPQHSASTSSNINPPFFTAVNQQAQPAPTANSNYNEPVFYANPSSNYGQNNLTHQQINARHTVPKDLPTFTGLPEEWPLFWSTYNWSKTICGLTDAENLVRLQKALRGEALRSVQHILIHPSCVSTAMSTLKLLYGQPEKILSSLKNKIKSLPVVNTKKLNTITMFAVEVKGFETTIKACGLLDELNNSSLIQELVCKMPSYFQLNWGSHKTELINQNKRVNLTEFANWIYNIGMSANCVNVDNNSSRSTSTEPFLQKARNAHVNTHNVQQRKKCVVCYEQCNNVGKCKKFLDADRNERWNIVRKHNLCKLCLRRHYGICNSNIVCDYKNCQIKHNTLLHKMSDDLNETKEENENKNKNVNINIHAAHSGNICEQILFKIIPITIYGKNKTELQSFAFIDEGSSISLINENILRELKINGDPQPLCLKWTGNMGRNEEDSHRVNLQISGPNKLKHSLEFRSVKQLSLPSQSINYKHMCKQYKHLKGLPIDDYKNAIPSVLLGINNLKFCIPTRVREGKKNEPIAICTRLGWLLCGNSKIKTKKNIEYNYHICECERSNNNELSFLMKRFYNLEMDGIANTVPLVGKDEQRALDYLIKFTKKLDNGHYETALLWRYDNFKLPQSFDMAMKRLLCLEKSLKSNKELTGVFKNTIKEYLMKGYITKIENNDVVENIWYLPIFAVFNKNKPNKTRIVWDAAAKSNGVSLNCMLLKGPDMLTSLPSILFRFRQKQVAVSGDIEQMFHQIFIRKEDRSALSFLWRDCNELKAPEVYVMNVLIFGASCAPCISQYIKNFNASKFEEMYPKASAAIKTSHYVDDFLISTDTSEEAIKIAKEVKYIHSQGGFNIRNWCSNNNIVLQNLNSNAPANNIRLNMSDGVETEKVLGIFWDTVDDVITFKLSPSILNNQHFLGTKEPTKREVLKILMSIYDPLGLIGNFIMYLKIVLQEIWRSGVDWDEAILENQLVKWKNWLSFLPHLENIRIPRCYLKDIENYNNVDVQLHTFVDASENGYAAVSYFRICSGNKVIVSLVGSKSRVAPLKLVSIPRLELMAALIGARFAKTITQEHSIKINRKIFWSDSQTVLSWIRSDHRKYHQFVAIRISEILDISEISEWLWISGKNNVADEATKWAKKPDLSNNSRWLNGPEFLKFEENKWSLKNISKLQTDVELKQHNLMVQHIDPIINTKRFSRWCRILRATAFIIRFCDQLKNKKMHLANNEFSQDELVKAETLLLKQAQQEMFFEEIKCIQQNKSLPKSSCLYKLNPYIDRCGVLRMAGRIENANVPNEFKHPVILPKYCDISKLIIWHYHQIYHHLNFETVVNEIRQKFYIAKLRMVCKYFIKQCQMCKVKKAIPVVPQMANLPRARLASFQSPFTFTGLDFFGPMFVVINRHKEKRYGALFTCLTIRAVDIEIVHTLNTSSCIMAIRNFMARRGQPREFFSDNGTNFVGADRELQEAIKEVDKNELVRFKYEMEF